MAKLRIGVSGWTYAPWRGDFYPEGLSQKKELEYASRRMSSIEINGTFYSLQRPTSFESWAKQVPADFCFAVKAPKYITHISRLKEVEEPLCNFLASGIFKLGAKLGPILWQLPPNMMLKDDRFEKFFDLLPMNSEDVAKLARDHTAKVEGRSCTEPEGDYPFRHAFEFRHPSFRNPDFLGEMRERGLGVVIADSSPKIPLIEDITADFIYVRMHGDAPEFSGGYTPAALKRWAKRLDAWLSGGQPADVDCVLAGAPKKKARDVFVYFSTEVKERSPYDALNLLKLTA